MGTKRCKGGGELRLVPGTGTMQTDQTRRKFGFLSHSFDQKRRDRTYTLKNIGRDLEPGETLLDVAYESIKEWETSCFHDFLSLYMTGEETVMRRSGEARRERR
jgi:hypothetical protein